MNPVGFLLKPQAIRRMRRLTVVSTCVEKISDRNGWINLERLGNSVFYGARYLLNT
jgi:hypothetical protein